MRAERLELSTQGFKVVGLPMNSQGESDVGSALVCNETKTTQIDSRLQAIIEAWPSLSEADRNRYYAIAEPEAASRSKIASSKRGGARAWKRTATP
jgi:hypothetical protein